MSNQNVITPIPLAGRGFIAKSNNSYLPGEYKRLLNTFISTDGTIKTRPSVRIPSDYSEGVISEPRHFIGHLGKSAIYISNSTAYAVNGEEVLELFDLTPMSSVILYPDILAHELVGFIRYNRRNYWISVGMFDGLSGQTSYQIIISHTASADDDLSEDVSSLVYAWNTLTNVAVVTVADNPHYTENDIHVKSVFMHKERLWIVTDSAAYFSKATDPLEFDTPDGGFFFFKEQKLNDAAAVRDTIYLVADSSVHSITYTTDPNTDASSIKLSEGVGGDSCTVFEDTLYLVKNDTLWQVRNLNISRVMDLSLRLENNEGLKYKIGSYRNFLIILTLLKGSYSGSYPEYVEYMYQEEWPNSAAGCFFINMDNGSVSEFEFRDMIDVIHPGHTGMRAGGAINDFYFVPIEDELDHTVMYFSTFCLDEELGFLYYLDPSIRDSTQNDFSDQLMDSTGTVTWYVPETNVTINSWSPDQVQYFWKKFRVLLMEADIPFNDLIISFSFDGGTTWAVASTVSMEDDQPQHSAHRFPINQRGQSLSIRFNTELEGIGTVDDKHFDYEIKSLNLLWTPTGKAPASI